MSAAPCPRVVRLAIHAAESSPCAKSQRGVALWHRRHVGVVLAYNRPPAPFACDGSPACRASCNARCVHAEAAVLLQAPGRGVTPRGAELLHVKVRDGQLVASGGPSCPRCSALLLAAGCAGLWLFHGDTPPAGLEPGWRFYTAFDLHARSLTARDLHVGAPANL